MDFFKSILSDDPNPHSDNDQPSSAAATWSFGGLIKTLATQSESVIDIYRRDLKEFGSGLQKETAALRDVAGRLPSDIDSVLKSTAEIISHSKDSLLLSPVSPPQPSDPNPDPSLRKYSRFESQLKAIETDLGTYCSDPEDLEDFEKWKGGFVLGEREGNETVENVYKRVVPDVVEDETFWFRYYYKVYKLKQQESLRANLVKRAISVDLDEEELSWDVDDEEDDDSVEIEKRAENVVEIGDKGENGTGLKGVDARKEELIEKTVKDEVLAREIEEKGENKKNLDKGVDTSETSKKGEFFEKPAKNELLASGIEEKGENETGLEKGVDNSEILKNEEKVDSDLSIVSTQASLPEEEDMGWDEIEEEVGSGDEKREKVLGSPNRADLRKRLSGMEEDEDLSWDIEDDDEPVTK